MIETAKLFCIVLEAPLFWKFHCYCCSKMVSKAKLFHFGGGGGIEHSIIEYNTIIYCETVSWISSKYFISSNNHKKIENLKRTIWKHVIRYGPAQHFLLKGVLPVNLHLSQILRNLEIRGGSNSNTCLKSRILPNLVTTTLRHLYLKRTSRSTTLSAET